MDLAINNNDETAPINVDESLVADYTNLGEVENLKVLETLGDYRIVVNPYRAKNRTDKSPEYTANYALVNLSTGYAEFYADQFPAALEILLRFHEGLTKIRSEIMNKRTSGNVISLATAQGKHN